MLLDPHFFKASNKHQSPDQATDRQTGHIALCKIRPFPAVGLARSSLSPHRSSTRMEEIPTTRTSLVPASPRVCSSVEGGSTLVSPLADARPQSTAHLSPACCVAFNGSQRPSAAITPPAGHSFSRQHKRASTLGCRRRSLIH